MNHHVWAVGSVVVAFVTSVLAQTGPDPKAGLHSVGTTTLGATAKGGGAPWNKDWPAINALREGTNGGALFGAPMTGAELEIRLAVPVDIRGIELFPLNYRGTRQIAAADIFIEGEKVASVELPRALGKGHFFPLDGRTGQRVMVKVTGEHPPEKLSDGRDGPTYGGWSRIRVYSTTDVAALMAIPPAYRVQRDANFIAPTSGALAQGAPTVYGRPRVATRHPKTIWDSEDIAELRRQMATDAELRTLYEGLKAAMDQRIRKPLGVPEPRQNEQGQWIHLPHAEVSAVHNALALDICNLGIVYALSGEAKYADYAKRLLLAYADAYPRYGVGARPGFNHDPSRLFDQRLGDATWQIQVCRGYDLIYNSDITEEERRRIEDDLLKASARFIAANSAQLRGATNWSAIGTCAVFITGVVTDDEELIHLGLFGPGGARGKTHWWEGQPNAQPNGMELHFSPRSIRDDGLWGEGAMGYQFMALQALIAYAEIMWHRGVDLYSYRDGALKRLFDSPLEICYPDLRTPAINDSGYGSMVSGDAYLYEHAYRRYRDPRYILVLQQTGRKFAATFQQFSPSVLWGVDLNAETRPIQWRSVNFFDVGYGILRNTTPRGTVSLLLDYGPSGSHDHPDKLNIDLWAFGARLMPDPGSIWYEEPLYRNWYATTVAHNTLVVDELNQAVGARVQPRQLVYLPAETAGIQRAQVDTAYSGVMMDRAVFVTPEYLADLFGAFAGLPRTYDLAWHPIGEAAAVALPMSDFAFPAPIERGYNELIELKSAKTDAAYTVEVSNRATPMRLVAAAGPETEVILGRGHLGQSRPPTILQRRRRDVSLWANALDYSADRVVKAVRPFGSLAEGFALAEIETVNGTDICFAAYAPGARRHGDFETDAQQAMVIRRGGAVATALLGGGTLLRAGGVELRRSAPGLAFVERAFTDAWVLGNPSPAAAEITARIPGAEGWKVYTLDYDGKRSGEATVRRDGGALIVSLGPVARVEIAAAGAKSLYDAQQTLLRRRLEEEEAQRRAQREAIERRARERAADAARLPVPANTVVIVPATGFSGQGGGSVVIAKNKRNAIGDAFARWDGSGHWLEWTFEAPAEGYYHLALVYCTDFNNAIRTIEVNDSAPDPDALLTFPSTGGWANNSDDWRLYVAPDPAAPSKPLLIKLNAGKNVIRLTNTDGKGVNLNYFAIFSPDESVTRESLAKRLAP